MATPWERELHAKKMAETAHVAVMLHKETSEALSRLPRIIFWVVIPMLIVSGLMMLEFLAMLMAVLGIPFISGKGNGAFVHPIQGMMVFVPFVLVFIALSIRSLFMRGVAGEVSRQIKKKIKCGKEMERAIFNAITSAPWSKWRYRIPHVAMTTDRFHRVTTSRGESRTIEFSDDMLIIVVGPEEWVDPPENSFFKSINRR